jgi:hypothetical protein
MNRISWAPLTGVLVAVLVALGLIIPGQPPGADSSAQEIVNHYSDSKDSVMAGAILFGFAALFLPFFAGSLRRVLRGAEDDPGACSAVALAGAAVFAVGIAIDATISAALAETVDDLEPSAVQGLQALWDNDFIPILVGQMVFLIASGISIVRHRALPVWLGWAAIVIGVISPVEIVGIPAVLLWILIVSVMLAMSEGRAPGALEGGGAGQS